MVTIGIDPHKDTHSAVAVDGFGRQVADLTRPAVRDGFGELLGWARQLADQRAWVIEDCRHVSGPLERFLLDHGETVIRLAPHLMASARRGVRERGKSDPIDALAVARAALQEGLERLPTARLAAHELELRLLSAHRQRLVRQRTALINDLRWHLHDLWPELKIPTRSLTYFSSQAQLARIAGCAPVPISSGRSDRHRLDRGGNRQLNYAIHMIALTKLRSDPQTALYIAKQRHNGKTQREALRCLKRHLVRRIYQRLTAPETIPTTMCFT
jgi:transposase